MCRMETLLKDLKIHHQHVFLSSPAETELIQPIDADVKPSVRAYMSPLPADGPVLPPQGLPAGRHMTPTHCSPPQRARSITTHCSSRGCRNHQQPPVPNSVLLTSAAAPPPPADRCRPNRKERPAGAQPGLRGIIAFGRGGGPALLSDAVACRPRSSAVC